MACLALALPPGVAAAQTQKAPPGNSGVQEYVETYPDGSGNRASNRAGNVLTEGVPPRSGVVSAATRRELGRRGAGGAAEFAEVTAPEPTRRGSAGDTGGDSALTGVVHTAGGEGPDGMGIFLPLFMLVTLVAAAGYAAGRRAGH